MLGHRSVNSRARRVAHACALAMLTLGPANPARADDLPTHGMFIHLDPFISPGWFPLGVFNALVAPGAMHIEPGFDSVASPSLWHWENQLDFVGLVGQVSVSVAGLPPEIVTFGPGPDIYIEIHQFDFPAELGPFTKSLTNAPESTVDVAWGVSVTEDNQQHGQQIGGTFSWNVPGGVSSLPLPPLALLDSMFLSYSLGAWRVDFIPPAFAPCPGDTNGDRIINFADLNAVLSAFGAIGPGLLADVNGDGRVNFADLNTVLSNFGVFC